MGVKRCVEEADLPLAGGWQAHPRAARERNLLQRGPRRGQTHRPGRRQGGGGGSEDARRVPPQWMPGCCSPEPDALLLASGAETRCGHCPGNQSCPRPQTQRRGLRQKLGAFVTTGP